MGTGAPTPVVIPIRCAPKKAPCPKRGRSGRRKRTFSRRVRTVAYLELTCGEYRARCGCCTNFRNTPEGGLHRALYDDKVRDLVLRRILDDGMSVERALGSLRREYLLDLSTGFACCVLRDRARPLDLAEHRREVLSHFRGTLCVDELHLGRFTLLLATDPLSDLPVAFALVDANDRGHMRRVRTNDHVERTDRMIRLMEKVRYKWRRRRSLVRFVVLMPDGPWGERSVARPAAAATPSATGPGKTEGPTTNRGRVARRHGGVRREVSFVLCPLSSGPCRTRETDLAGRAPVGPGATGSYDRGRHSLRPRPGRSPGKKREKARLAGPQPAVRG